MYGTNHSSLKDRYFLPRDEKLPAHACEEAQCAPPRCTLFCKFFEDDLQLPWRKQNFFQK